MSTVGSLLRSIFVFFVVAAGVVFPQGWVDVTPAQPGPAGPGVMCYDPVRAVTWLFLSGGTHSWDGASWTTVPAFGGPSVDPKCATWDPVNQAVVVCSRVPAGDSIFSWNGSVWSSWGPVGTPGSGSQPFIAFDSTRSELVMVSVDSATSPSQPLRTRVWDGVSWNLKSPVVTPPGFNGSDMRLFFDHSVGRVVYQTNSFTPPVTPGPGLYFEWTGSNWVQRFPSHPLRAVEFFAASAGQSTALLQQFPYDSNVPRSYEYSNGQVSELFLSSWPSQRTDFAIAYDEARDVFVLHGGGGLWGGLYADTWELSLGASASYSTFGAGCQGSVATPSIAPQSGSLPRLNSSFALQVSGLPWSGQAFMLVGFSSTFYGSTPLPWNLSGLGAPLCTLYVSPDILIPIPNVLGTSVWTLPIPGVPGLSFYNQAVAMDGANQLGLVFSNAGLGVTGQ